MRHGTISLKASFGYVIHSMTNIINLDHFDMQVFIGTNELIMLGICHHLSISIINLNHFIRISFKHTEFGFLLNFLNVRVTALHTNTDEVFVDYDCQ